jgi:FtsZ-binding cell division protein ZapB
MLKYYIGATLALLITIGLLYAHTGRLKEDNQSLRERVSSYEQQIVNLQQELTLRTLAKESQERVVADLLRQNREADIKEQSLLAEIDELYRNRKTPTREVLIEGEPSEQIVQDCYPYSALSYSTSLLKAYGSDGE